MRSQFWLNYASKSTKKTILKEKKNIPIAHCILKKKKTDVHVEKSFAWDIYFYEGFCLRYIDLLNFFYINLLNYLKRSKEIPIGYTVFEDTFGSVKSNACLDWVWQNHIAPP